MRQLNARQKKILRDWIRNCNPPQFIDAWDALDGDNGSLQDSSNSLYWRIYNLNPHENFDSNVERFVSDNAEPTDYFGGRW